MTDTSPTTVKGLHPNSRSHWFAPGNKAFANRAPRGQGKRTMTKHQMAKAAQGYGRLALDVVVNLARNTQVPPGIRLQAAKELLDRGYGKPKETVLTEADIRVTQTKRLDITGLTDTELDALESALRQTIMKQAETPLLELQANSAEAD